MSHLHCPTVSCCHFSPQSNIRFSAVRVVCWRSISLYIMRQFEKHSSCLGSPDYGSSTANCFPPRWLGIINRGVLGGRIQLPTVPAHTNAVQNIPSDQNDGSGWKIKGSCDPSVFSKQGVQMSEGGSVNVAIGKAESFTSIIKIQVSQYPPRCFCLSFVNIQVFFFLKVFFLQISDKG